MAVAAPPTSTRSADPDGYPVALRDDVDRYLQQLALGTDPACRGLADAAGHILLSGGKRVRPVLVLATARALGLDHRPVLPLAGALELIHTCSLIHDDLPAMDDDDIRRGRPTTHRVFGEDVAILAGDALFAEAFRLLTRLRGPSTHTLAAMRVVADALGVDGLAGGQFIDVTGSARDESQVLHMHRLKTGRLLEAAACSVVELARPPVPVATALQRYACELGLMFQIIDDVLDVVGPSAGSGRPAGSDARNARQTLVTHGRIDAAVALADGCFGRITEALASIPCDPSELLGVARLVRNRMPT
jgi:geranylgeranyl diphosphate synthase, type II